KPEAGSEVTFTTARETEAEAKKKVCVRGSRETSVRRDIEPRTRRGQGLAVEWPKGGGRSQERGAFKRRIPAPISSRSPATIPARGTTMILKTRLFIIFALFIVTALAIGCERPTEKQGGDGKSEQMLAPEYAKLRLAITEATRHTFKAER